LKLYEGMFVLDSGRAGKDWEGASAEVEALLGKHGATTVKSGRWDERKLAYEIKGHRRGTYMLTYFEAPPAAIDEIRRDCELSELVLRNLILLRGPEYPIPENLGKMPAPEAAPATEAPARPAAPAAAKKEG
jgi:small subunit ribosomal protein S6